MKRFLFALLLFVASFSHAQIVTVPIPGAPGLNVTVGTGVNALPLQNIYNNPNAVNITTSDDWYNEVPLGFNFPFFGQTFTNSWAATNGFVTFQNPQTSGLWGGCCSGVDLTRTTDPRYNYTIYGLHTDLYSWNGANQYYLRGTNQMTYGWYNISQCCGSQGGNSFEIKINSSGLVDTRIAGALVSWNAVTSGMAGNLANGEYYQYYHGQGINIPAGSAGIFSWQALNGTGQGVDQCTINPLYNPSCPGYAAAYLTQQCTISALYNPSCPGYQQAYYTQQCTINPLYDVNCPGYATAYYNYQCSVNPLYHTGCPGYETAYLNQQCLISPLYSSQCAGYAEAVTQCSANPLSATYCPTYQTSTTQCAANALYAPYCPGYSSAQATCSTNPLSNTLCNGYSTSSQVCSNNQLTYTYCPSYTTTLAACSTNPRSNTLCPGYSSASSSASSSTTSTTAAVVSTSAPTASISSDGTVSTTVSKTGDSNVDKVISTPTTSTSAAAAPAAPVQLSQPSSNQQTAVAVAVERKQDKQEEKKNATTSDSSSSSSPATASTQTTDDKKADQPKTARQELQERRVAAARAAAVEAGKNLANNMGKAASLEQQVAVQNVVIAAMGFTPGFDTYNKAMIPDGVGYKPFTIYNNQRNVDNARLGRGLFGPTDRLHNEMVDSQYNRGN